MLLSECLRALAIFHVLIYCVAQIAASVLIVHASSCPVPWLYTLPHPLHLLLPSQIDLEGERQVTPDEGALVARDHSCLYYETSAKNDLHVQDAVVWGLLAQIMDTPSLLRPPPSPMDMEQPYEHNRHYGAQCLC